jgi:hypothetical protein
MKKTILVSLTLIAAIGAGHAQKLAPVKGQKLEAITTTSMKMELMGQAMNNETVTTTDLEVKNISTEGYVFTNSIKRMILKVNSMGQDMNFDSDKKEDMDGEIGQSLKDKLGVSQDIQVDKRGKVLGLNDSAVQKKNSMSDMMSMGTELTEGQPYSFVIQLPAKTIKPGDSWTDSIGSASVFKTVTTYTLKSIGADGAVVSFAGTLAKNGTMEQNGMEIQMDMTGTSTGESLFDAGTGLLKTSTSTVELKGNMSVAGQSVPISGIMTAKTVAKKL